VSFRATKPRRYTIIGDGLTVGLHDIGGKPTAKINIGPLLLARVGWSQGTEVVVEWGLGDDHGRARLAPGTPGFKLRPFGKRALSLGLVTANLPPGVNDDPHQAELCRVSVTKSKAIEVDLPKWFFVQFEPDAFADKP